MRIKHEADTNKLTPQAWSLATVYDYANHILAVSAKRRYSSKIMLSRLHKQVTSKNHQSREKKANIYCVVCAGGSEEVLPWPLLVQQAGDHDACLLPVKMLNTEGT